MDLFCLMAILIVACVITSLSGTIFIVHWEDGNKSGMALYGFAYCMGVTGVCQLARAIMALVST